MKLEKYDIESAAENTVFEFTSVGLKGEIPKIIQFEITALEGVYNLAFGDKDVYTGEMNDSITSDNGDTDKVLATVSVAVYSFFRYHPQAVVFFSGSTPSRTRLYQMKISRFIAAIREDFEILGETVTDWEPFKIGNSYNNFLVKQKFM